MKKTLSYLVLAALVLGLVLGTVLVGAEGGEGPVVTKIPKPTANTPQTFTGEELTGVEAGTGYTVAADGNTETNAGSYTAVVTLADGYIWDDDTDTPLSLTWLINPRALPAINTIDAVTYNGGNPLTPAITFNATGTLVPTSEDYDLEYTDNETVGTGKVTAKGKRNFLGEVSKSFEIKRSQVTKPELLVSDAGTPFTGSEITGVKVHPGSKGTNTTATNAGNYDAKVELIDANNTEWTEGGTDPITFNWTINKIALPALKTIDPVTYDNGNELKPFNGFVTGGPAPAASDYTLSYENNTTVPGPGNVTAKATDTGNFMSSSTTEFRILPKEIAVPNVIKPAFDYNGGEQRGVNAAAENAAYTIDGELVGKDARNYEAFANLKDTKNTVWADDKTTNKKTLTWVINPIPMPAIKPITSRIYNGEVYRPEVLFDTTLPILPEEYDLNYSNNTDVGEGKVVASAKANTNYTGKSERTFNITALLIAPPEHTATFEFDGKLHTAVKVDPADPYTVSGHTGTNAGEYTAVAKLKDTDNHAWKKPGDGTEDYLMPWTIKPTGMPVAKAIPDQTYTTRDILPEVVMEDDKSGKLVLGKDFELKYENNRNVGEAVIHIKGLGNYQGAATIKFKIVPAPLPAVEKLPPMVYTGKKLEPAIKMSFGGDKPLVLGKDYTLGYVANQNVGTATVTATGIGNYKATSKQTFDITPADLPPIKPLEAVDFNGKAHTPDVEMSNPHTGRLEKDKDYTLAYAENTKAGTATITVTGIGNYKGVKETTFVINPILLPDIAEIANLAYTGQALEPDILMKDEASGDLVKNRDFKVVYANNTDGAMINSKVKDKPFATVTGLGNYKDEKTIEFVIADTSAPVFDVAASREANGSLRITVRDDWGLKSVRVLRNGRPFIEEDYSQSDPRVMSYDYEVVFIHPGSYQVFATDLYGHVVNLYNTSGKEEDLLKAGRYYVDTDKDGLSDFFEISIGTDPENPDTDGDGLIDGDEYLKYHTKPLLADSDGDGLTDAEEVNSGYFNPNRYDTDFDGVSDTVEAKLREQIAANTHHSSLALELLLNPNRAGTKPVLTAAALSDALQELVSYNLLQTLDNPYAVATERTRVQYTPTAGEGNRVIQTIPGSETMLVKLNPKGTQLAAFEHTLLKYAAGEDGKYSLSDALNLNLLLDKDGKPALTLTEEAKAAKDTIVVLSDHNGTILLVAAWDAAGQQAAEDLVVVDVARMIAYRLPESAGATRFDVSPGGSKLAFLKNGKITLIDLKENNQFVLGNKAGLLAFIEQEQLVIRMSGGFATAVDNEGKETKVPFNGIIYTEQPTNNYRNAILVQDGIELPFTFATSASIMADGRVYMRAAPVLVDAEMLRPEHNSVRLYPARDVVQRKVKATLMRNILNPAD